MPSQETTLNPAKTLSGSVRVPPDKSLTHRAVLFSSLAKGESTIKNPLEAADCLSTLQCVEQLGCTAEKEKGQWRIQGKGLWGYTNPRQALDCGNSGTTMRLLSGILAAQGFSTELKGDVSLSKRPMDRVAEPLRQMGATVTLSKEKYPPFKIQGSKTIKPLNWTNPVASAQVKSCVLLAGLHAKGTTTYEEPFLSRDHTERMLKACGVSLERKGTALSLQGPSELKPQSWVIPGDFSSAAFFLAAGLLVEGAQLALESVNLNPTRTGLLTVFKKMGAVINVNETVSGGEPLGTLQVKGASKLKGVHVGENESAHLIDEVPLLAVVASQAEGTTELSGFEELRLKETDRLAALHQNLSKMGGVVREKKDGLIIEGPTPLKGARLDSFGDHRIAMAFAIASLVAEGSTTIENSDCVGISYPTFWSDLRSLTRA